MVGLRLCIETSGDTSSLALFKGPDRLVDEVSWNKKKSGQELATHSLKILLEKNNFKSSEISSISLSQGPGSFTGLRVGFNLAKVLCFSHKIPVTLLDSLLVQATSYMKVNSGKSVLVVNNAQKNLFFVGMYKDFETQIKPTVMSADELFNVVKEPADAIGNAVQLLLSNTSKSLNSLLNARLDFPNYGTATDAGYVSYTVSQLSEITDYNLLTPLYLRPSQAEENLALGVIKPQ